MASNIVKSYSLLCNRSRVKFQKYIKTICNYLAIQKTVGNYQEIQKINKKH